MNLQTSNLIRHWKSQNLKIAPPAPDAALEEFETRNRVVLLSDFRDYFHAADGMIQIGGHDCDQNGFAFWPLARIKNATEECTKLGVAPPNVERPAEYFVFADYLQWSWAYAIRLVNQPLESNEIIHVGTDIPTVVATSFTEFLTLYLRDDKKLYPDTTKSLTNS